MKRCEIRVVRAKRHLNPIKSAKHDLQLYSPYVIMTLKCFDIAGIRAL